MKVNFCVPNNYKGFINVKTVEEVKEALNLLEVKLIDIKFGDTLTFILNSLEYRCVLNVNEKNPKKLYEEIFIVHLATRILFLTRQEFLKSYTETKTLVYF